MFLYVNKENLKKGWKKRARTTIISALFLAALGLGTSLLTGEIVSKVANISMPVSASGNWGLSFQNEGSAPVGNATKEELKEHNAYYIGDESEKVIYLTFDAGYENGNTPKILDTLKKHEVPACFFLVGNYIEKSPELVKRMVDEGHTVGNHTMHHPDMSAIGTEEAFKEEIGELETLYKEVTGKEMVKVYRPPQGKYSESNLMMAEELGYKTIFWSLAYVDWYESDQPEPDEAINTLTSRIHPGAIVLLHSTSSTNASILDEL
ncbi:MAG: polysaccharide deacetylase family protein, partial [Firmicutes bacterium]|nr:polysaccharide deacetylase family protein [Bacillota bacterium]